MVAPCDLGQSTPTTSSRNIISALQQAKKLLSVQAELTSDFIISPGSYRLTAERRAVQCYEPPIFRLSCAIYHNFYYTAELFECKFNIKLQATTESQDDN